MSAQQNRKILGNFLKSHRNRLSPEQVGLPIGHTYRRTPGLRREEVAHLANVSVTWYTWLEQGREVSASPEVLNSIALVLGLTSTEREYMHKLAGRYVAQKKISYQHKLTPAFKQMVQSMPYPCVAIGPQNELIAWNALASEILVDFSSFPPEERVMLRLNFLNAELRSRILNWEHANRVSLAFFRKLYDPFSDQEWHINLINELISGSKQFSEWWKKHEVAEKNGMQVEILHPECGHMYFEIITFNQINDLEGTLCCMYAPVPGTGTEEKLDQIRKAKG